MTPPGLLRQIVIVGGGSAGWMTAAALSSLLDPREVTITLVESDAIGTVGVGEATIPDILAFNRMLGIGETEFMKATQATFKLGIEFVDWGRKGDRYVHPFGQHGVDMQGIDFHQYWLRARGEGATDPIEAYSLCAVAAQAGRFVLPDPNPRSVLSQIRYAYHFDATLYAAFLRRYAEARGVRRVEGAVRNVRRHAENGFIAGLDLGDDRAVDGDFFFDCTGFRALLAGDTLGVGFVDWSHWLPCDRALAVPSAHQGPLAPYTRSTARDAGWQWRIPTQRRVGNGHIYASAFLSDDRAADMLLSSLDGAALADPRPIRFRAGCREAFWTDNCIAIGLAAGFLEPLESTSIYLIQEGISRFISLFPRADIPDIVRTEYNRHMRTEFEQVRDFIILHYGATERDDTPFWDYCRTMKLPDTLVHKIELFRRTGRVFRYNDELFARPSWIAVMLGQHIVPQDCDPVVATLPANDIAHSLKSMRGAIAAAVERMPMHQDFIERHCPADSA
ncbi:tryptophan halogenase family protein [Sphingomonas sp.]|uniref:tryptophan halogenase family protein n=1 Tax=Sphingomonas sp. TaxID=28214 RepID=UPI002C2CAE4F|nr:tryptophan halogenase family protein [Sphingomonas sp.]HTG39768.1 tryptophan halogenase family protein [Sphingomonas sp.]